jgi:hypothetical protein
MAQVTLSEHLRETIRQESLALNEISRECQEKGDGVDLDELVAALTEFNRTNTDLFNQVSALAEKARG